MALMVFLLLLIAAVLLFIALFSLCSDCFSMMLQSTLAIGHWMVMLKCILEISTTLHEGWIELNRGRQGWQRPIMQTKETFSGPSLSSLFWRWSWGGGTTKKGEYGCSLGTNLTLTGPGNFFITLTCRSITLDLVWKRIKEPHDSNSWVCPAS